MSMPMTHATVAGADALALQPTDNVATVLRPVAAGERLIVQCQGTRSELTAMQAIPFGHKISRQTLFEGDIVRKYGEAIGHAVAAIDQGMRRCKERKMYS